MKDNAGCQRVLKSSPSVSNKKHRSLLLLTALALNDSHFWVVSDSVFTEECILKGSSTAETSLSFQRVAAVSQVEV